MRNLNPADPSDVIAEFPSATAADTQRAIEAAKDAFRGWRDTPGPERGRVLWRAAEIARRRAEEIARTMTREEGKILREARGEVTRGIAVLEYYAGAGFRISGQDHARRGARHLHLHDSPAARRRRADYAVELPLGDPGAGSRRPRSSPATPSCSSPPS